MEKRRPEKRQQPSTNENGHPGAERNPRDYFRSQRRVGARSQRLNLAKGGAVERQHIDPGKRHERKLEAEGVVVEILIRVAEKEHGPGEQVHHVAADSPRNEPVNGPNRDALGQAEYAEVKQADRAEQEREPEIMQRLA